MRSREVWGAKIRKLIMARPSSASLVVVGSLNVDFIASVSLLPKPGDTVVANQLSKRFGGKGGNQALSAARHGAQVMMLGCLGDDPDGRDYRNHLRREGVNCSALNTTRSVTGCAHITVDAKGENQIVVIPGANGTLTGPSIKMQRARIAVAGALLVQLEIPMESAVEAIKIANESKVSVILNASPVTPNFPWNEVRLDAVIVNENEAREIFGLTPGAAAQHHESWKERLTTKRIRHLVITRGANPTLLISKSGVTEVPAHPVEPVDTVGAGDTFAGVFATQMAEGAELPEVIRWANAAAALSTLKHGAQEGIPYRGDVQSALLETKSSSRARA
jgi:ribokinase